MNSPFAGKRKRLKKLKDWKETQKSSKGIGQISIMTASKMLKMKDIRNIW
jgi:hypothetical protein